jgi:hypothetical protein
MAHYLAEQMDRAKRSAGKERVHAEQECFDTILRLWSHRREMPDGRRPFEALENAISVVDKLDPEKPSYFYHRPVLEAVQEDDENEKSARLWLDMAEAFDRGARVMIEHCIRMAAATSVRQEMKWIELAQQLRETQALEITFIERILPDGKPLMERRKSIEDYWSKRIEQLRAFGEMAKALEEDFQTQMASALSDIDTESPTATEG